MLGKNIFFEIYFTNFFGVLFTVHALSITAYIRLEPCVYDVYTSICVTIYTHKKRFIN